MKKIIYSLLLLQIAFFGCDSKEDVNAISRINLINYDSSLGEYYIYGVTRDSLKINHNCDYENCSDSLIFSKKLLKESSKKFFNFLSDLKIDTLQQKYSEEGFDGIKINLTYYKNEKKKTIKFERYIHPQLEEILYELDKLVPKNYSPTSKALLK
ncbi:hypothetical protein [uncultured Winogradskyella sp.]|uniref:hypothetical protein n=1 Tax=uncultured Winogradskyella sp. TaxID=395353 RepID=UPI002610D2E0|nr:hypothetical protein [uncultured Winogradskyella sp.]